MKIRQVAVLSMVGMMASCVGVYSLTPPGSVLRTARAAELGEINTPQPRFSAAGTLEVDGRLGHALLPAGDRGSTFLLFEARAMDATPSERGPVSLALVIDQSGSMAGERMNHAIKAAKGIVGRLADGDEVTLISFDAVARLLIPATKLDADGRAAIARAIESVSANGETCVSCGVSEAMRQLRNSDALRQMIVLSDGKANGGIRDVAGFRRIATECRGAGIAVTTVGVGLDYNEETLVAVAEGSNGRHHFVADETSLPAIFEVEAQHLASTVARRARLTVRLAEGVELVTVHDRAVIENGKRIDIALGTFSRAEVKTVLLEIRAVGGDIGTMPVASVEVSYDDLIERGEKVARGALSLGLTSTASVRSALDPFVAARLERSRTSAALESATRLFNAGRAKDARAALDKQAKRLEVNADRARTVAKARGLPTKTLDDDFKRQRAATSSARTGFSTKAKPRSFNAKCGCSSNDLTCHLRCSSKDSASDATKLKR
jgi:Ca-activated chloride channel family protein